MANKKKINLIALRDAVKELYPRSSVAVMLELWDYSNAPKETKLKVWIDELYTHFYGNSTEEVLQNVKAFIPPAPAITDDTEFLF